MREQAIWRALLPERRALFGFVDEIRQRLAQRVRQHQIVPIERAFDQARELAQPMTRHRAHGLRGLRRRRDRAPSELGDFADDEAMARDQRLKFLAAPPRRAGNKFAPQTGALDERKLRHLDGVVETVLQRERRLSGFGYDELDREIRELRPSAAQDAFAGQASAQRSR